LTTIYLGLTLRTPLVPSASPPSEEIDNIKRMEDAGASAVVLFAIPRTAGWIAQWEEMLLYAEQKIARPRQLYLGHGQRDYVPIKERRPLKADSTGARRAIRAIALSAAAGVVRNKEAD